MQYRRLGNSGLKVSVVSLGTWLTVGNALDEQRGRSLVDAALDAGVNLFDTADVYHRGEAERALGGLLKARTRQHLVLASKCFFPMSDDVNDRGLSRKHIFESLHGSLRRLGTDYLDLYQCHRFDPETPTLETARAFDDLIRAGKILYWGLSQWPAAEITAIQHLCRQEGLHGPISNQPLYNLVDRGIETDVIPASIAAGIGQIVYSPLAQGLLTGKYLPGQPPPAGSRASDGRVNQFIGRYLRADLLERAAGFTSLATAHGCTPAALALAFCLCQQNVASVIVGATTREQLLQNLTAVDLTVPASLLAELDRMFKP